jgi:hypothetical protein
MSESEQSEKTTVWVLIRWDAIENVPLAQQLTVKEILPTKAEADAEARRLNELVEQKERHVFPVQYFVKPGKYFTHGRNVQKKY